MAHFGCPVLVDFARAFPVSRSKVDLAGKLATEKHAILRKSRRFIYLTPQGYRHEAIGNGFKPITNSP